MANHSIVTADNISQRKSRAVTDKNKCYWMALLLIKPTRVLQARNTRSTTAAYIDACRLLPKYTRVRVRVVGKEGSRAAETCWQKRQEGIKRAETSDRKKVSMM